MIQVGTFRLLFCLTNIKEHSNKSKDKIQYSSIPSVMKPMSHGEKLHVPETPSNWGSLPSFAKIRTTSDKAQQAK
jgi:hypothetical protein